MLFVILAGCGLFFVIFCLLGEVLWFFGAFLVLGGGLP